MRLLIRLAALACAALFTAMMWVMHHNAALAQEPMPWVTTLFVCAWVMVAGALARLFRYRPGSVILIGASLLALVGMAMFNRLPGAVWFGLLSQGSTAILLVACVLFGFLSPA